MGWKKGWATTPTPPVFTSNTWLVRHPSAKASMGPNNRPSHRNTEITGRNQSVHTGAANKPVGQQRQSSLHPQLSQDSIVTGMSLCLLPHRWGDAGGSASLLQTPGCRGLYRENGSKTCRPAWKQPWMESDGLLLGEGKDEIIKQMKCQRCVQGQVGNLFNV